MITDEQTKELAKNQVFQWVAIKAAVMEGGKIFLGKRLDENDYGLYEIPGNCKPVIVLQNHLKIVYLVVSAKVVSKKEMFNNTEELAEIDFYSKEEVQKMLDQKQTRPVYQTLL